MELCLWQSLLLWWIQSHGLIREVMYGRREKYAKTPPIKPTLLSFLLFLSHAWNPMYMTTPITPHARLTYLLMSFTSHPLVFVISTCMYLYAHSTSHHPWPSFTRHARYHIQLSIYRPLPPYPSIILQMPKTHFSLYHIPSSPLSTFPYPSLHSCHHHSLSTFLIPCFSLFPLSLSLSL